MTFKPDPKGLPRIVDPTAGKNKISAAHGCRVCGANPVTRAHLVARGQGGDDLDVNIVPLCGHGTAGCHAAFDGRQMYATPPSLLGKIRADAVARMLWVKLLPDETAYIMERKGEAWAARRFKTDSSLSRT